MAAEKGSRTAEFNLGVCYDRGHGVEQNYELAVDWYKKSAAHGYDFAMTNLGSCYDFGNGVEMDKDKAAYWYKRAAKRGVSSSAAASACFSCGRRP